MTRAQQDAFAALKLHGSIRKAAKALGVSRSTVRDRIAALGKQGIVVEGWNDERRQAYEGQIGAPPIPEIAVPPDGFVVHRNSGVYDADGKLLRQSVSTVRDSGALYIPLPGQVIKGTSTLIDTERRVKLEWIRTQEGSGPGLIEALQQAFADHKGMAPVVPRPSQTDDDTWTIYPLPDLHLGMLSWGAETGSDYDLKIAIEAATLAVSSLVSQSRTSKRGTLIVLGDFAHADDQKNVTPGSGHRLDVDGRHPKIYLAGVNLLITLVDMIAQKHESVDVKILPGNHDPSLATTATVALALYYSNQDRIKVDMKPGVTWYSRFGKCLVGANHGDTMKPERAAMAMAVDCHEDWGQAIHRHIFRGHYHSEHITEVGNVRVETLQSPAARDAWNNAQGYRSGRSLQAVTFHKDDGEIGRHRVSIQAAKEV